MIELGRQFGLYVIKEMIAENESFVFCKAEDPFFNREVTLKVYAADYFNGSDNLSRVDNLLEKLAILDHPSIAPVYDSGVEGDYYYYTSACYYGGSLATQAGGELSTEQLLKLLSELVQAFDYASSHQLENGSISAEKIYFDAEGRAVINDFGIDHGIVQILAASDQAEPGRDKAENKAGIDPSLFGLGQLLLSLTGTAGEKGADLADQVAGVADPSLNRLLQRLLLDSAKPFACWGQLLAELSGADQQATLLNRPQAKEQSFEDVDAEAEQPDELPEDEQSGQTITEIRQLVAEKNNLQHILDKAIYDRNLAENQFSGRMRELTNAQNATARAQEEANVAWELVAGQKYERWRPAIWTLGGFMVGFLLSGSYGYYYSEQTRNELLARLQVNEELIKTATLRAAEQVQTPVVAKQQPAPSAPPQTERIKPEVTANAPVKEVARQWWPAGSEFSAAAAIPVEKIRAALGMQKVSGGDGLSTALRREVLSVVSDWADSWSKQDLRQYFSHYSDRYSPELGRSQREWRDQRRNRLTRPQFIELDIDDIRFRKIDDKRIQVKLKQSYRSDYYQDRIMKSINLIHENGRWRILKERSLGMVDGVVG